MASKEYSKNILPFLKEETRFITCLFGQMLNGKLVEKATWVKMARGEMVRYMAECEITDVKGGRNFDRLNLTFQKNDPTRVRLFSYKQREISLLCNR
ncbi:peroxide stress protein YaaA [Paenibacillus sp. VT-400]|uniref:peroxide stress protein YaaA n=1 Tax=Paenibacillus sp. VT-400 TaxID=1495853 RepID=UPI000A3E0BC1|nr:peroxide stress protein YaaA [Paenibacillus sp. VT-400]